MKTWLRNKWDSLRTNFWFVPTQMVAAAIVLSFVTLNLDKVVPESNWIATLGWWYTRGPEGSRAVLSTVAASMITIASVTFSITIVALQLASSQFGPRLLRNFMRDRGNQIALGTFIATFTYCLLILRAVNGMEDERFVPHIAVSTGLMMALGSLGVLIYFIHHAAASIQADNVIATVSAELHSAIDSLFPAGLGRGGADAPDAQAPPDLDAGSRPVGSPASDYIQAIDEDGLLRLAQDRDLVLRLVRRPGQFVLKGAEIVRAWPAGRVDDDTAAAIRALFYLGHQRTLTQDVEFAFDQLVEIALRALSPGINDPFTAITCVDRLAAALSHLAERPFPDPLRRDDRGRVRIVADTFRLPGLIDSAFHQIRQAARTNVAVTLRLLEAIAAIAPAVDAPDFRAALLRHAALIYHGSQQALPEPADRVEAEERYLRVLRALDHPAAHADVGDGDGDGRPRADALAGPSTPGG